MARVYKSEVLKLLLVFAALQDRDAVGRQHERRVADRQHPVQSLGVPHRLPLRPRHARPKPVPLQPAQGLLARPVVDRDGESIVDQVKRDARQQLVRGHQQVPSGISQAELVTHRSRRAGAIAHQICPPITAGDGEAHPSGSEVHYLPETQNELCRKNPEFAFRKDQNLPPAGNRGEINQPCRRVR